MASHPTNTTTNYLVSISGGDIYLPLGGPSRTVGPRQTVPVIIPVGLRGHPGRPGQGPVPGRLFTRVRLLSCLSGNEHNLSHQIPECGFVQWLGEEIS